MNAEQPAPISDDESQAATEAAQPNLEQTFAYLQTRGRELLNYGFYWLELHWDKIKVQAVWYAILAVTGVGILLTLALIMASAAVLLVIGSGQLLGEHLFDGSAALGYVTVGASLLLLVPLVLLVMGTLARRYVAAQLAHKYALKKELQRTKYGQDVEQRAASLATA